jgi:hypothetical protein
MSKYIELSQNKEAIVDDDDYERLSKHKWSYNCGYAIRAVYVNGKRTMLRMHCEITSPLKDEKVHHKNKNGLDNRKENLIVRKKGAFYPVIPPRERSLIPTSQKGSSVVVRLTLTDVLRSANVIRSLLGEDYSRRLGELLCQNDPDNDCSP